MTPDYITPAEIAARAQISLSTISRMAKAARLEALGVPASEARPDLVPFMGRNIPRPVDLIRCRLRWHRREIEAWFGWSSEAVGAP